MNNWFPFVYLLSGFKVLNISHIEYCIQCDRMQKSQLTVDDWECSKVSQSRMMSIGWETKNGNVGRNLETIRKEQEIIINCNSRNVSGQTHFDLVVCRDKAI